MDFKQYSAALEALLFASGEPVEPEKLAEALEIEPELVQKLLKNMKDDLEDSGRGLMLVCLGGRYQLTTKVQYAAPVKILLDKRRAAPLSPAALEVLAVIAYNQPVSRSFVEQVRGVDSSSVVQTLLQKNLVEEAGRLDLPGRPISYRTTDVFLRSFGLSSLSELPELHEQAPDALSEEEAPFSGEA